jgi:phage gp37-like protein
LKYLPTIHVPAVYISFLGALEVIQDDGVGLEKEEAGEFCVLPAVNLSVERFTSVICGI